MANYYLNNDYSLSKTKSSNSKTKKKTQNNYTLQSDGTLKKTVASGPSKSSATQDIAPVKTTTKKKEEDKWYDGWFKKSEGDASDAVKGTGADLLTQFMTGVSGMGETVLDTLAYLRAPSYNAYEMQNGGFLTSEDHKVADVIRKESEEFIKKDLYDEKEVAKKIVSGAGSLVTGKSSADVKKYLDNDMERYSVMDEKARGVVQSAGQLGATALLSPVVPWYVTTGMTSFGGQLDNALNDGATYNEAGGSALIAAGAEILTEKLSGGISFGSKTADDAIMTALSKGISNKGLRALSKVGVDIAGEGSEEVISEFFSKLGTKLYKEEDLKDILLSEEAVDDYITSFISGGVLGGVSSAKNVGKSAYKGTDVLTGYSKNEQTVFNKVLENRIQEQEKQTGKKLTSKEKSKLYDEVENAFERGEIEIDEIENILGGETLNRYNSLVEQEDSLTKKLKELGSAPNTVENAKQYEAIDSQLKELQSKNEKAQLKEQLSKEVESMTKSDARLQESYVQSAKRKQDFTADLSRYDAKSRETVQRAIDSGILNDTRKTHEFVDLVAKLSAEKGVSFDFLDNKKLRESGFALEGKRINGFKRGNDIVINMESRNALNTVVGHEITHVLEGSPELYSALAESAKDFGEAKGIYKDMYDTAFENYKDIYKDMTEEEYAKAIEKEVTADLVAEYVFSDIDFVRGLSTKNRNVFQKVYDEIKYFLKSVTTGSDAERKLLKVKKMFEEVYRENSEVDEYSDADVKYSIREEAPPKETGVAYKVFYVKDGKLYPPMVANPDGAETPMGVWLNADVGTSAPPSKTGRPQVKAGGKGTQGGSGSLAFRPGWHLGDLPRASQFDRVNPETGKKELFPENFVWAEVEYAKDVDYQEEAMSYGYTDKGKFRHAYAGLPRLPENGYYRYRTNPKPDTVPWVITGAMKVNRLLSDAEVNAILEENGVPPVHRQGGDVELDKFGFNNDGTVKSEGNQDIKFSISDSVETGRELVAVHNLTSDKLLKTLELGAFPMPSIAVTKSSLGHSDFGDISFVFGKDTINPSNKKNKVYAADAWTPTFPRVEYEVDTKRVREIRDSFKPLLEKLPERIRYNPDSFLSGLEYNLDNYGGYEGVVERALSDESMKQAYLAQTDNVVEDIMTEKRTSMTDTEISISKNIIDSLGEDVILEAAKKSGREIYNNHGEQIGEAMIKSFVELGIEEDVAHEVVEKTKALEIVSYLRKARDYINTGGVKVETKIDYGAISNEINSRIDNEKYKQWLKDTFSGIEKNKGISNGKDIFTPSGNRRSFSQTHYPVTADNIVKSMLAQSDDVRNVAGFNGIKSIRAVAVKEFKNIEDIRKSGEKLKDIDTSEFEAMNEALSKRLHNVMGEILDSSKQESRNRFIDMDNIGYVILDACKKPTIANIKKTFGETMWKVTDEQAKEIKSIIDEVIDMPVNMFEAKPLRSVGFDEVEAVLVPSDIDSKLREELTNRGLNIVEYEAGNETDRATKLNELDDMKFSISNSGQSIAPSRNGYYSNDLLLENLVQESPDLVQDEVIEAPVGTNHLVDINKMVQGDFVDDYAPLTESEANVRDDRQIEEHYFPEDIPEDVDKSEQGYNGNYADHITPSDPFYEKDIFEVGKNRKQKAYMYENPEVKPFFQQEARYMMGELNNSTKGERLYNDQLYYDTNGEQGFFGTKRHTSEEIAYLLDTFGYTYKDIAKGLNAIIEDNGKENNAISKRIEFLLDERLRLGYTDFVFGDKIPPNQEYINLLNEKQINEYNDEAFGTWVQNLSEEDIKYFTQREDDIAPISNEYAPIEERSVETNKTMEEATLYDARPRRGVVEGQQSMFEESNVPKTVTRSGLHSGIMNNIKTTFKNKGFDFDDVLKKAKNLSTFSTVDNTPQRVMEKALGYKEGQVLSDLTVNRVAQNETEGIKWLNSFTDRKNGLLAQLSKQYNIKSGSKESAAAQMYAEGFYVNEANEIISYGDRELSIDFPDARVRENIKGLANDPRIRQIYDDTLRMINESRTRNAYPEIPRLDNYFLHFRAMDDTFSRLGLPFNPNDIRAKDLPTDLNGVTADLKPGQPYFASAMHRSGKRTSFDLLGGMERYLTSAKNQIYHIDDIQTLRALRNYIADTYGQAQGLENLDALTEEEAQMRIEQVYNSHLSTFAKFLNEEANILAGKTALIDRGIEGIFGRRAMQFMNTLNRQVGSNMVGYSASSALVNIDAIPRAIAKTNKADFVKAFAQFTSNKIGSVFGRNDGFAEQSPVMIRRKGAEQFHRTPYQKVADTGYVLMGAVDNAATEIIARTKYNELVRQGMDSQKAHFETDKWVSRLMGDRSLGQMPQLFNSKTLGLITKFQLEVRNNLDSMFYDTIQEAKVSNEQIQDRLSRNARTAAKATSTIVQLAIGQHLFGKAMESVVGYNPSFDIISVLMTALGFDDDEESEDTALDNIEQGFLELVEDLPYASTFTGGRIPIASALPINELITGKDEYGNDKSRLETLGEIAPYYVMPAGYGQYKKTKQGLGMFDEDLPVSGSYTDSGNLRFPVEDALQNRVQAGLFGQYANENARDYFDNERDTLKEKQIQEYKDLELPIREYWDYREGLKKQDTLEDKFEYINDLDVTTEQKNIMINNVVDRKEKIDMSNYDDFSNYEEFDWYTKNTEKYNYFEEYGVSVSDYLKADDDTKDAIDADYRVYKEYPEKVTLSKAISSNWIEYRGYYKDLYDIRADKDANGKSISGTAKAKKMAYIENLNLDAGQKMILHRIFYDGKSDMNKYNPQIVEYLDSRNDISYAEMVTILEELGMKVHPDGRVTW